MLNIVNVKWSAVACCILFIFAVSILIFRKGIFCRVYENGFKSAYIVGALMFCGLLAINFYDSWIRVARLKYIADIFGIKSGQLVLCFSIVGTIIAIPFVSSMLWVFVSEAKAFWAGNGNVSEDKRKTFCGKKAFLILFGTFFLGVSAILRADFNYIDDMGRVAEGYRGWDNFSRFFSKGLATIIYINDYITDLSPFLQIIAIFLLAVSGIVLLSVIYERKEFSLWEVIAVIPIGLNPYFLECISYKFDSIFMALSILVSVLPLVFRKSHSRIYISAIAICMVMMCTTYQAASGIFPMLVIFLTLRMWNRGGRIKELVIFVFKSIIGYGVGILFFRIVIMNPVESYVSTSLPEITDLPSTIVDNLSEYYHWILMDFAMLWKIMIFLLLVGFIWSVISASRHHKVVAFIIAGIAVIFLFLSCFGLYIVLKSPLFAPRGMYSFGILIAILCINVAEQHSFFYIKFPIFVLSWSFFILSLTYGNALYIQKTYTDFRITQVISDLNDMEIFAEENPITVQISGSIGLSPAVQPMCKEYSILKRLIPVTFQESWWWGQYGFYRYYNLKNVIRDDSKNLEVYHLPLLQDNMYHTIYGNEKFVLIELK